MTELTRVDIHQHLWPEDFVAALARRGEPPLIRSSDRGWVLRITGEPEYPFDPGDHDRAERLAALERANVARALIVPSCPLGIEYLPAAESERLLGIYHAGLSELGHPFSAFGGLALEGDLRAQAEDLLRWGFAGVALPAEAMIGPERLEALADTFELLERHDRPLFVHPGPANRLPSSPKWWPAMTDYVASMNTAWHSLAGALRRLPSKPTIIFAMLAGGAPFHGERLAARGGSTAFLSDPRVFYDTSSYGPRAIDALVRIVGIDQVVYGSDAPVIEASGLPPLGEAAGHAISVTNPRRALGYSM